MQRSLHLLYYKLFILNRFKFLTESSRIRTYIRNLEGFCPDPLDDRLIYLTNFLMDGTGLEPVAPCL